VSHEYVVLQLTNYVVPATLLAILALGLNLQWGHTGLFNAGVAAYMGVGAYLFGMLTTGNFAADFNIPPDGTPDWLHWGPAQPWDLIPAALAAMVVAAVLGVLVAVPTLRLRADYLAIATLAFAEIVRLILKNERRLTGGDQTLAYIPRPFGGIVTEGWASDGVFMLVALALLVVVLYAMLRLTATPWGRALKAVREDEEAAEAMGKNAFVLKLGSIAIGCAVMGLAGALTVSFQKVAIPDQFVPFTTFTAYVVVILGGSGNPKGAVLGAYVFALFGWATQQAKAYLPDAFTLRIDFVNQIVIGLMLILIMIFRPEGMMPEERYVPRRR